jgi:PTH1 family peptidyl-tRNA hydrolase
VASPATNGTASFVFVGLGNPGPQYAMTRHNMGYLVVQALAAKWGWLLREDRRFNALVVKGIIGGVAVHLLLPLTFMTLSGSSVQRYLEYFKLPLSHLVVVTDDIALNYGDLRLKVSGSAGGHNGLKSIQSHLGTANYMRLRMGVGHPGGQGLADYVLDPFTIDELKTLQSFIDRGVEVLQRLLKESASQVMNAVNTVPKKEPIDLTKPPLG